MILRKMFFFLTFSLFTLIQVFSLDFGFTTYFLDHSSLDYEPSFAISFDIKENIDETLDIEAKLLQESKNNYTAFCTAHYKMSFFAIGGGFFYDILGTSISPGFVADTRIYLNDKNIIGLSYFASFSPENLAKNFTHNGKFYLDLQNKYASFEGFANISYILSQEAPYNLIFTSGCDITGFDEKSFLNIGLISSSDLYLNTQEVFNLDLIFRLGGKIVLNIGNFGTYFFVYESNLFRMSERIQNVPSYNMHIGARFRVEN